jgi:glycosidase
MAEWLIKWDEGEIGALTPRGLSLWLGRPVREIQGYLDHREEPPADWWTGSKHRSREALPHLHIDNTASTDDIVEILRYWADKEFGADVLNVDAGLLLVER